MKPILIISNMYPTAAHPHWGVFVKNIAQQLSDQGFTVETRVIRGKLRPGLNKLVAYLSFLFASTWSLLRQGCAVQGYVHFAAHSGVPVLLASVFRKLDIVVHVHGGDVLQEDRADWRFAINVWLSKRTMKLARAVVVPSEFCRQVVENLGVEANKIHISPSGGVNAGYFTREFKSRHRFEPNRRLKLGYVGRLEANKGVNTMLSACAGLTALNIDYQLTMIGQGALQASLQHRIANQEFGSRVTLIPGLLQSRLAKEYADFDVLLVPSETPETLCLVALEALSVGTPVIGSHIGAIVEYLKDGRNGWTFSPGDSSELLSKLKHLACLSKDQYQAHAIYAAESAKPYHATQTLPELMSLFTP